MAFNRSIRIPAFNFATHDLTEYGESKDLGSGKIFHDCINFTYGDQAFDRLYICHPLVQTDLTGLSTTQLRDLLRQVRGCQALRRNSASVTEREAREKSIAELGRALGRQVAGSCCVTL
jgi:hypothetical protein